MCGRQALLIEFHISGSIIIILYKLHLWKTKQCFVKSIYYIYET